MTTSFKITTYKSQGIKMDDSQFRNDEKRRFCDLNEQITAQEAQLRRECRNVCLGEKCHAITPDTRSMSLHIWDPVPHFPA